MSRWWKNFFANIGKTQVNERTVGLLIDERARCSGDSVFLVDPLSGEELTYQQLQQQAAAVANFLVSRGVQTGGSVAYAMNNGRDCAVCLLGILYGGFRATAINLIAGSQSIGYVIAHSQAGIILTQKPHKPRLHEALEQSTYLDHVSADNTSPILVDVDETFWSALPAATTRSGAANSDDDALLMYTSGTTGRPKGVVLTHSNLIAGGDTVCQAHQLSSTDRALCVLPLFHINGLCVTVMGPLVSGGSVVMADRFSTSSFWQWIRNHSCTWCSVVPTQISYLLHAAADQPAGEQDFDSIRFARSASAPLAPDMHRAFEQQFGIPVIETMGLTETAAQILSNPLPPAVRKIGSAGIAFGDEVIIGNKHGKECARGETGEIRVRGPNVMTRYFRDPEVSQEAITPDGWLCTGDLGTMDDDGYVFVTGRLKELIIKGGENIAPREVDEALYHHVDVVEAAAFPCPCNDYGQRVEAAVMLKPGSKVKENELLGLCEQLLGKFKKPDRIHFLPELPKGPSGKIQRLKLVEILCDCR
ncbi:MAG: AMP-binding protein [Granulosicoccus sp.]